MPVVRRSQELKVITPSWSRFKETGEVSAHWRLEALKTVGHVNKRDGYSHTRHLTNPAEHVRIESAGVKLKSPGHYLKPGSGPDWYDGGAAAFGSDSVKRKAASAMLAKIPFPLAQHIARCFKGETLTSNPERLGSGPIPSIHVSETKG